MSYLHTIADLDRIVHHTPLLKLKHSDQHLYAKLEYTNLMGSIKDRAACYILKNAISQGRIDESSVIVESTSGNFGVALAVLCKKLGLKFVPVIDANITQEKEALLEALAHEIVKVEERDSTGGYLLNRLAKVQELLRELPGSFNPNQYENPDNYLSYYHTLASEICDSFTRLDFAFVSVSTGGTVTGLSLRLKEKFPGVKIIAVDIEGSVVFGQTPCIRRISGLGSSFRTPIIEHALIDNVMILSHQQIVEGCNMLLREQGIFAGGSSGAAYYAAVSTLESMRSKGQQAVFICPDKGSAYLDTIYNQKWVDQYVLNRDFVA